MLFNNQFSDFSPSTPASCPSFSIDNYKNIIKVVGEDITINGTDIGWNQESIIFENSPKINITIPNNQLVLTIPAGEGENKTFDAYFMMGTIKYTFNYSYETPVIESYSHFNYEGMVLLSFNGTGFSVIKGTNFTINGVEYPSLNLPIYGGVVILPGEETNITDVLRIGEKFTVSTIVGGQQSNTIEFVYFKEINFINPNVKLNSITLKGVFGTTNINIVSVTINGESCTIISVNASSLSINYPSLSEGVYPIIVLVGNSSYESTIEYIYVEPTPTSSSSSPSNSSSSSPPSNSFSSFGDDEPSNSSFLYASFYLLLSTLFSSYLII